MDYLLFQSSLAVPNEEKSRLVAEMDYSYHILNFEFPQEHSHADYWEFLIVLEGNITHVVNGKKVVCGRGSFCHLTTQDHHYLKRRDKQPIRYLNIVAKEKAILNLVDAISPDFKERLLTGEREFLLPENTTMQVEELMHKAMLLSPSQHKIQNNLALSALMLLLQFLHLQHIEPFEEKKAWQESLNKAMLTPEFLTYKIDDLCNLLSYSKSQLNRLFQKHYGVSPHDFLINQKFLHACNLLLYSDMKIIDIATKVGYKNLSQFNVTFKEKFGVPPSQYRKHN